MSYISAEDVLPKELCIKHKNGVSIKTLATTYSLTEKSIQRIIRTTSKKDDLIQ